ncbi:MAG: tetratricopeptide repeat protein [Fimbriimonadales bacterium]|nr:tetratricopeptide repeat protein [Fimbriimonadales bacterium]
MLTLVWAWTHADAQPKLLIFYDRAPKTQHNNQPYDPNIDLKPHLTPFLEELRKVQVEWYRPDHPIAQQFAQRRDLRPEQLVEPSPALRAQLARAWGATYVMTVRCTRTPEKPEYEYRLAVWELGKRAPVWETEGFQQLTVRSGQPSEIAALQSLGRTLAVRLDTELWESLPRVAAPIRAPAPASTPRDDAPPADPKQLAEQLLRAGRYQEALLPLRALVNAEPNNPDWRMQLIRLYRRLNLPTQAKQELERAAQLHPHDERLALEWASLLRAEGNLAGAIARLQDALGAQPRSTAVRFALFDLLLEGGDVSAAERVLQPIAEQENAEVEYRRYLLHGATRQLENLPPVNATLTEERAALWLQIGSGLLADLASELLDLRRLAASPSPNWAELRPRSERAILTALNIGQWLNCVEPTEPTRKLVAHTRFASQMLAQAAQHMARYVLSRKTEEEERASLLRIEAMRELEAAKSALPQLQP